MVVIRRDAPNSSEQCYQQVEMVALCWQHLSYHTNRRRSANRSRPSKAKCARITKSGGPDMRQGSRYVVENGVTGHWFEGSLVRRVTGPKGMKESFTRLGVTTVRECQAGPPITMQLNGHNAVSVLQ